MNAEGLRRGVEATMRNDLILLLVFLAIWLALQRWILPRLGVVT
jgi:hypothetical protein